VSALLKMRFYGYPQNPMSHICGMTADEATQLYTRYRTTEQGNNSSSFLLHQKLNKTQRQQQNSYTRKTIVLLIQFKCVIPTR